MNYSSYILRLYDLKLKSIYGCSDMVVEEYTNWDNCIDDLEDYNYFDY